MGTKILDTKSVVFKFHLLLYYQIEFTKFVSRSKVTIFSFLVLKERGGGLKEQEPCTQLGVVSRAHSSLLRFI